MLAPPAPDRTFSTARAGPASACGPSGTGRRSANLPCRPPRVPGRRASPLAAAAAADGASSSPEPAAGVASFLRGRGLAAPPPPAPVGEELGWLKAVTDRYHLGRTIGSGSYGVVYLGIDKASGGEVAVKAMLKQRPRSTRERTLKKLVREAALTARVQACDGVVKLLGAYEDADRAYLVMERLRGGDLESALERGGPLPERAAAAVARDVLRVIAACHAAGCMHGDVKPANFVLREPLGPRRRAAGAGAGGAGGDAAAAAPAAAAPHPFAALASPGAGPPPPRWLVAIDFGCSQPVGRASLTRRTGTPVYMAPEVFRRDYGPEADLWSAGVMLYQLLSGRFPWWPRVSDCRACSVDEVMRCVLGGEVPYDYGRWVDGSLSPACAELVQGLLTRDPRARLTAEAALASPWFGAMLGDGCGAGAGAGGGEEEEEANNVVPIAPGAPDHAAPEGPPPATPPQAAAAPAPWFTTASSAAPGPPSPPGATAMA